MSKEILPYISNEVADLFAQFNSDTLADVLRLWDCVAQEWVDGTTTVFRFENDDLLVWNEMGRLRARKGAVDTASFDPSVTPSVQVAEDNGPCFAWRPDFSFNSYLGESKLSKSLLDVFACSLVSICLES